MNADNEIRTLTLRFGSKATAMRFFALAERLGYCPSVGQDDEWFTVTTVFQNKAARSRVVAAWARESTLVTERK